MFNKRDKMKLEKVYTTEIIHPNTMQLKGFFAFTEKEEALTEAKTLKNSMYEVAVKENGEDIAIGGVDSEPTDALEDAGIEVLWR
jgi:hypothetical protein